jgi:hypothetical protein
VVVIPYFLMMIYEIDQDHQDHRPHLPSLHSIRTWAMLWGFPSPFYIFIFVNYNQESSARN